MSGAPGGSGAQSAPSELGAARTGQLSRVAGGPRAEAAPRTPGKSRRWPCPRRGEGRGGGEGSGPPPTPTPPRPRWGRGGHVAFRSGAAANAQGRGGWSAPRELVWSPGCQPTCCMTDTRHTDPPAGSPAEAGEGQVLSPRAPERSGGRLGPRDEFQEHRCAGRAGGGHPQARCVRCLAPTLGVLKHLRP